MTIINLVKSPKGIVSAEHIVENEILTFLQISGRDPLMDPPRPGDGVAAKKKQTKTNK